MRSWEWKRKLTHAGFGLFAFTLRWLSWPEAAAVALVALAVNFYLLPRFGKGIYRDPELHRDPGIVAYPAMVLLLIVLFRHHLEVAAAAWAMMAIGDPAASAVGGGLGGPPLPWNRKKTWAGSVAYLLAGGTAAALLYVWVSRSSPGPALAWLIAPAAVVAAFLESYPTGLDDNWVTPLPASLMMYAASLCLPPQPVLSRWAVAAGVNAAVAAVTGGLGIVSLSGAVAGAIAGAAILGFGGWPSYAVLWTFFLAGTLATKLGYREKRRRGTAQPQGGRRGIEHVVANCGVGVLLCLLGSAAAGTMKLLLSIGFAASFAAALADTFGTEVGSLYGRRAFSLTRLRAVPPGTRGAVSLAGTAAGLAGGLIVGGAAFAAGAIGAKAVLPVGIAGLAGSLVESLVLDLAGRRSRALDHEFVNAANTLAGALIAMEIARWHP